MSDHKAFARALLRAKIEQRAPQIAFATEGKESTTSHQHHGGAEREYGSEGTHQGAGCSAQTNGQDLRRGKAEAENFTTTTKPAPKGALTFSIILSSYCLGFISLTVEASAF
jgi:hypothetical protein